MTYLYLDIETLPTDRADVREYIAATIKPPGNISKPETIAKWMTESRPEAVGEAIAKTGLDGSFGRVCVIGWAFGHHRVQTVHAPDDEPSILKEFSRAVDADNFSTTVIGHNVSSFDLRFLVQRYIVNGIRPPLVIHRAAMAKPWEIDKVYDTMVQWSGVGGRISLDKLCMALSIKSPKGEIDGSQVAAVVAAGRIEEVAAYCKRDVEAVRQVHARMTFQDAPAITPSSSHERPQPAAAQRPEDINF
jgi:hypothetical protein